MVEHTLRTRNYFQTAVTAVKLCPLFMSVNRKLPTHKRLDFKKENKHYTTLTRSSISDHVSIAYKYNKPCQ